MMIFVVSSCPACLGLVGTPFLSLDYLPGYRINVQGDYTYLRQSQEKYFRSLNYANTAVMLNLLRSKLSLGFSLPVYFAYGFMRDNKYHEVRSIFGLDIVARYMILKRLSPSRPTIYTILSVKFPLGYLYHEEHGSIDVPKGITLGAGGSRLLGSIWQVSGEVVYSYYLPGENYTFGDRVIISMGMGRFISLKGYILNPFWGLDVIYTKGDIGLEPYIKENTNYLYSTLRWGVGLASERLRVYPSAFFVPFYRNMGNLSLPVRFGLNFKLSVGF